MLGWATLYMANVNKIILWVLIPILLSTYIGFRLYEWREFKKGNISEISHKHYVNLENNTNYNCLILGGSNSFFSLSAQQMSEQSQLNCYNLSLLHEGFSDKSYFDYVEKSPINKNNITHIFYSSISIISHFNYNMRLERNKKFLDISGNSSFFLLGGSMISHIKSWLLNSPTTKYPLPNMHGDFNFSEYSNCDKNSIVYGWKLPKITRTFIDRIEGQFSSMRDIFPNAQIYLVLPSKLQKEYNRDEMFIHTNSLRKISSRHSVFFIEQLHFKDVSFLCDSTHHTNAKGREMRTLDLILSFKAINQ